MLHSAVCKAREEGHHFSCKLLCDKIVFFLVVLNFSLVITITIITSVS